jgi:tetratricopeptide (TPR) repeat protein
MQNRLIVLCAVLLAGACSTALKTQNSSAPIAAPAKALPLVLALPNYPLSMQDRPTTDGQAYLTQLDARLQSLPKIDTPHSLAVRAGVLFQRYQALGALADLDAAYALAKQLSVSTDADADALLLSATIFSHMHEFDTALALLDRLGDAQVSAALRAEIADARTLTPLRARTLPNAPLTTGKEYGELVRYANDCIDRGELACASDYFHQAQFVYTDVAPMPLAWLHTQQGIALLRFEQPELASRFFRAALTRVPNYYLALEHLAECEAQLEQFESGRKHYKSVIAQTGNPEYMAGLAALEASAGNAKSATAWQAQAKAGYAKLLAKFPSAYAQHAVNFYLEAGELAQAEQLTAANFKLRQDASAYILLAETKFAAHDLKASCAALVPVFQSGRRPPEAVALQQQLPNCPI